MEDMRVTAVDHGLTDWIYAVEQGDSLEELRTRPYFAAQYY